MTDYAMKKLSMQAEDCSKASFKGDACGVYRLQTFLFFLSPFSEDGVLWIDMKGIGQWTCNIHECSALPSTGLKGCLPMEKKRLGAQEHGLQLSRSSLALQTARKSQFSGRCFELQAFVPLADAHLVGNFAANILKTWRRALPDQPSEQSTPEQNRCRQLIVPPSYILAFV
eukprot:1139421-Pelagomonas_calceolata.AAC.6